MWIRDKSVLRKRFPRWSRDAESVTLAVFCERAAGKAWASHLEGSGMFSLQSFYREKKMRAKVRGWEEGMKLGEGLRSEGEGPSVNTEARTCAGVSG